METICLCPVDRRMRRRIQRLDRKTRDANVRVRCRVILKVSSGLTRHAAASQIGCAPSTAWRIVDRFRAQGEASLLDERSDNGAMKVDDDVREGLREVLQGSPQTYGFPRPTWTLELLTRVCAQVLQVSLSVGHMWRVLKSMGVRLGRPRPVVGCPWKSARRRRRVAQLRRLATNPKPREVVLYVDEVDIHLNPRIGPDWMLPRQQRLVVTPGQNQKRYLAGAYDPLRKRLVYVEGDRKTSWLFLNLLHAILDAYSWASTIHLILDNYVIHKSQWVKKALPGMSRIRLHFLPPYCPNENRIERLWLDLHANVTRNHRCQSMKSLVREVSRYLDNRLHTFKGLCVTT